MGCPPWGFLAWGVPRKGGFQGGKPRRGASGTSLCSVPADFSVSSREGGGRGAAQGAGNSPPASCSATARVALLLALKRRAKREARSSADRPQCHRRRATAAPAAHCPQARRLARARRAVDVCKPAGRCPCTTIASPTALTASASHRGSCARREALGLHRAPRPLRRRGSSAPSPATGDAASTRRHRRW